MLPRPGRSPFSSFAIPGVQDRLRRCRFLAGAVPSSCSQEGRWGHPKRLSQRSPGARVWLACGRPFGRGAGEAGAAGRALEFLALGWFSLFPKQNHVSHVGLWFCLGGNGESWGGEGGGAGPSPC